VLLLLLPRRRLLLPVAGAVRRPEGGMNGAAVVAGLHSAGEIRCDGE
jgi:hypothetical protein